MIYTIHNVNIKIVITIYPITIVFLIANGDKISTLLALSEDFEDI